MILEGLLSADLCLIPKADKPFQLRPLGILRPDAKGLAGTLKELLGPYNISIYTIHDAPSAICIFDGTDPVRCSESSRSAPVREVKAFIRSAQRSRRGLGPPALVGGITFALDLCQAFDTVSKQEILDLLLKLATDPTLVSLVHGLQCLDEQAAFTRQLCGG